MTRPEEIDGYEVPLHVALTQPITADRQDHALAEARSFDFNSISLSGRFVVEAQDRH